MIMIHAEQETAIYVPGLRRELLTYCKNTLSIL